MHKSGDCVLGNVGNLKSTEYCPQTIRERPQVMNTHPRPKAYENSELHDFSRFPERLLLLLIYYIV